MAQVLTEELGVVPGNRVLLRGPNNPWIVAAWLGVLKAGAVVVTTMPMLRSTEVATIIGLTKPVVAISDHRFVDELAVAAGEDVTILTYGADTETHDDGDLTSRCLRKSGEFTAVDTASDDVALLGPTSGTTGVPKVTMHFHRDILANADTFARYILEPTEDDVFAGSPPLAFTFGLGGLVVFPLRFGASALLTEKAGPVELAERAAEAGATVLFTAPTAYRAILKENRGDLLKNLRVAVSAGSTCPRKPGKPSTRPPACGWSTESAPRKCCTFSSPRPGTISAPAPRAKPCPATGPPSWTKRAMNLAPARPVALASSAPRVAGTWTIPGS